jgi:hypothetical protein
MDMHKDIKAASALPATWGDLAIAAVLPPAGCPQAAGRQAGEPPAGEPQADQPTIEPKIGFARIVSPPLSLTVEMATTPASSGVDAPEIEPPLAAKRFEETKPESPRAAAASREIILLGPPARAPASRKSSEFIWLAALVVLAAAFGAAGGVLGATGLTRLAGEAAPAEPTAVLQTAIAELRSDITALKVGLDTTGHNTSAQYTKLVERLDRAEHAQTVASKSDAAFPKEAIKEAIKETTGSVTPPASAAAAPLSPAPVPASGTPPTAIVPGWAVRDVYRGVAMLQSRMGGMVEVEAGDVLPNLGRIEAIRRQDGRWVVITSRGMIMSMR